MQTYAEACNVVGHYGTGPCSLRRPNNELIANLRTTGMRRMDAYLICAILARIDEHTGTDAAVGTTLDEIKARLAKYAAACIEEKAKK